MQPSAKQYGATLCILGTDFDDLPNVKYFRKWM